MLYTIILSLSVVGSSWARDIPTIKYEDKQFILGPGFPKVLGYADQEPGTQSYTELTDFYKRGCVECVGRKASTYAHPNACNFFITCVDFHFFVLIHANSCGKGTFYDERYSICVPHYTEHVCERVGNPCQKKNKIPVNQAVCDKYMICDNSTFTEYDCDVEGYGFNAITGQCDVPCARELSSVRVISETCSAADDDDHMTVEQLQEVTAPGGTKTMKTVVVTRQCAADLKHLQKSTCVCDRYNKTNECEDVTSVHLFSSDNTWMLARNNAPVGKTSAITGNGTVTNRTSTYPGSAFFEERNTFFAHGITGNDLGLRFSFKFNFLAMHIVMGDLVPGMDRPNDQIPHNDFALADNSICGIGPTYGCKLVVSSTNRGRVVCYVKPQNKTEVHVEKESGELDLTKRISVYFAKDDTKGVLSVKEEGRSEQNYDIEFPEGIRAEGNSCPLTIAAGTKKRYFRGYMDDMELIKHCVSFL